MCGIESIDSRRNTGSQAIGRNIFIKTGVTLISGKIHHDSIDQKNICSQIWTKNIKISSRLLFLRVLRALSGEKAFSNGIGA